MARSLGANSLDSNNKNNSLKKPKDKISGGENHFYLSNRMFILQLCPLEINFYNDLLIKRPLDRELNSI